MDRPSRDWVWVLVMGLATAWYAWPQLLYSLFPVYDFMRFFLPEWAQALQPWVEAFRSGG